MPTHVSGLKEVIPNQELIARLQMKNRRHCDTLIVDYLRIGACSEVLIDYSN